MSKKKRSNSKQTGLDVKRETDQLQQQANKATVWGFPVTVLALLLTVIGVWLQVRQEPKSIITPPATTATQPQSMSSTNTPIQAASTQTSEAVLRLDPVESKIGMCSDYIGIAPSYINLVSDPVFALKEIRKRQSAKTLSLDGLDITLVDMTITSTAPKEYIRLSNKVSVEIIDYKPLPTEDAITNGCGGAGEFRDYSLTIDNSAKEFDSKKAGIDYYTLQPGELEVFKVSIRAKESGVYKLKLGIEYEYQGKTNYIWTSETYYLYTPERFRLWQPAYDDSQFQLMDEQRFINGNYISLTPSPAFEVTLPTITPTVVFPTPVPTIVTLDTNRCSWGKQILGSWASAQGGSGLIFMAKNVLYNGGTPILYECQATYDYLIINGASFAVVFLDNNHMTLDPVSGGESLRFIRKY